MTRISKESIHELNDFNLLKIKRKSLSEQRSATGTAIVRAEPIFQAYLMKEVLALGLNYYGVQNNTAYCTFSDCSRVFFVEIGS